MGDFKIFCMEFLQVFQAGVWTICKALSLQWEPTHFVGTYLTHSA